MKFINEKLDFDKYLFVYQNNGYDYFYKAKSDYSIIIL